jgi:hypothetical protein
VLAGVLLSTTILATPSLKAANAQVNLSAEMNQTQGTMGLPVDSWLVLKKDHPALANIEQSQDVKDAIAKIREMANPKQVASSP